MHRLQQCYTYSRTPGCRIHCSSNSSSIRSGSVCTSSRRCTRTLLVPGAAAAEEAAALLPTSDRQQDGSSSVLENLLEWLLRNGVTGIADEGSLVALYEDEGGGERGMLAVQDIPPGQLLVRLPLRLAITDVMEEEEAQQLVGQGQLWQDRLVAKLLQQVQQGPASPWWPYLQALPCTVPSALQAFGPAEAAAVQLPATYAAISQHAAKMAGSWSACRPDAIGGADLQTYAWAHSIVMSRTFGNAAQQGGIGVRMLAPLIDMLNHAGDETDSSLPGDSQVTARDNVRWDVMSPSSSPAGAREWEMLLTAKSHIPAGSPLLLSYFEGANDELLLHYGFVPPANPHDTVQLFPSITAALEHLWHMELAEGGSSALQLSGRYQAALEAGLQALQEEVAAAAGAADSSSSSSSGSWGALLEALEPVKVASGGRISSSLITALESLHQGDMAAVESAVAGLAWQQLCSLPTLLLHDLALLVSDCQVAGDEQGMYQQARLLQHYVQAMVPAYAPEAANLLAAAAANRRGSSSNGAAITTNTSSGKEKKRRAVPLPAAAKAAGVRAWEQLPLQALVNTLAGTALPPSPAALGLAAAVMPVPLSHGVRSAVKFRVSKKMLLMDVVLAARVPLPVLEQQLAQGAAAAAAAASAATVLTSDGDGDGGQQLLPWDLA